MSEEIYLIPSGTKVWSVDLQENVSFDKDIFVSLEHKTTIHDYVFVLKRIKMENMALCFATGTDCSSYLPTKNEFLANLNKLIFIKKIEINEHI
jgi:hypothetical protein